MVAGAVFKAKKVLFVEETDPFIEDETHALVAHVGKGTQSQFLGKRTGAIPSWGEMNVDIVLQALRQTRLVRNRKPRDSERSAIEKAERLLISRPLTFCAGCTHRNVYWVLRKMRKRLGGHLVVTGDIGCYSMGVFYDEAMQTMQAMGSGLGTACGLGQLGRFGFDSRVVAMAGDSTFFHACMPALVNAKHKGANITFLILDNATTAMTGFQTHPGSALQEKGHRKVSIAKLVEAVEPDFMETGDATNIEAMTNLIGSTMDKNGLKVLILNSICRLEEERHRATGDGKTPVDIKQELCRGESCRICASQYGCPAISWDFERGLPVISDQLCVGCGACIDVCPHGAISGGE
jgi:indolepyruvate ferredoxin oxidoreductase alpha subunit